MIYELTYFIIVFTAMTIMTVIFSLYFHKKAVKSNKRIINLNEDGKIFIIKELKKINRPYQFAKIFIKNMQCSIVRSNLDYNVVGKDVLRHLKKYLSDVLKEDMAKYDNKVIESFLIAILEVGFFVYSLNMITSATYKISQIIILICKYLKDKDAILKHSIYWKCPVFS